MKALFLTLIVLSIPRLAIACSFAGSPAVCGSFAAAEAVLVGTVSRVETKTTKTDDSDEFIDEQTAYVQVEESFKGVKESQMIFRSNRSSCEPTYQEGQRWLFYAYFNQSEKAWEIHPCDRSTRIEGAYDDLSYLRNFPASAQKSRIAGVLSNGPDKPLMGIKVKVTDGRQVYETFTDKNGVYEILGLPPGKYSIEPEVPITLTLYSSFASGELDLTKRRDRQVTLAEKSCAGMDFYFNENTSVSGKVFGADGRPLNHVCVTAISKDAEPDTGSFHYGCTKENGSFKIDKIPLGDYLLVANEEGRITSTQPFPRVYYPGVFDRGKATVLTIASGDQRQDFDIHVPSEQPTWTIEGRLLYSDGRPVNSATVEFTEETAPDIDSEQVNTTTDPNGRFSLIVLAGLKGSLRSSFSAVRGDYDCPQFEKLIKSEDKGQTFVELFTNVIKLEMNRDYKDVELNFPFPECSKRKAPQP